MLNLSSSFQHTFLIDADRFTVFDYLANWKQSLPLLPHISIVKQHSSDCFRMLYSTNELGLYRVQIFCDAQLVCDDRKQFLRLLPLDSISPVKSKAGFYSLTGHGCFTSETELESSGRRTWVHYNLHIESGVPVPKAYHLLPKSALEDLLHKIVQRRLEEIVTEFARRTARVFTGETFYSSRRIQ